MIKVVVGVSIAAVALLGKSLVVPAVEAAHCSLAGDLSGRVGPMPLGETTTVSLTAFAPCATRQVILGFGGFNEAEGNTAPNPLFAERQAVAPWLRRIDLTHLELGIVRSDPAQIVQPLTTDRVKLLKALWSGSNVTGGSYRHAIEGSRLALGRGAPPVGADQGMIIFGDYLNVGEALLATREADLAKNTGIEIYVVSGETIFGSRDPAPLATTRRYVFSYVIQPDGNRLREIPSAVARGLAAVEDSVTAHQFATIGITSTVPAAFDYVPNSAQPPAAWDPVAREMSWTFARPSITTTVSYEVRARVCGSWTLPERSVAWGRDTEGFDYFHQYDVGDVEVPCPTSAPTVTPTQPTATATASPTATTRPTGVPRPVYLPLALRESPCRVSLSAAVALVIDTSSSMLAPAGNGRTKLETATEAAGRFLDILGFPNDQAAIVAFDSAARVAHELTGDKAALRTALAGLQSGTGTRIDLGVAAAYGELTSPRRHSGNLPAMVVLTDGQATDGPQAAIVEADRAKQAGVLVFTIGLGDTVDQNQLRSMASRPEWFYLAATADDLAAVYDVVAEDLPCPGDRYWGRRP